MQVKLLLLRIFGKWRKICDDKKERDVIKEFKLQHWMFFLSSWLDKTNGKEKKYFDRACWILRRVRMRGERERNKGKKRERHIYICYIYIWYIYSDVDSHWLYADPDPGQWNHKLDFNPSVKSREQKFIFKSESKS